MTGPDHVVIVILARLQGWAWPWGWWRVARGQRSLARVPGLVFAKALGSGQDGGFGLWPSAAHQGLLAVFDHEAAADAFVADSGQVQTFQRRSRECCVMKLRATSSRGSWGGHRIAVTAQARTDEPVVSLTRASIRPSRAWNFWVHSPPSEASLRQATGCRLAVGLGEAPLLRQATLSCWERPSDMDAYARSGAHQQAIQAAQSGRFFTESMFVRFKPLLMRGTWQGVPLG